jgi:hypothetical protein
MRVSFEIKIVASTIEEAKSLATKEVSRFLDIPESAVEETASLELKVSYPKAETVDEISQNTSRQIFEITVYGSVKQSTVKAFGS